MEPVLASLVSGAEACLRAGTSRRLGGMRWPPSDLHFSLDLKDDFEAEVLKPNAPLILALVREDARAFMLIIPVMRHVGKEEMADLVKHLALEGLPSLSTGPAGAGCRADILKIVEDTLGEAGAAAPLFPPFFDFALEKVLRRLYDSQSTYMTSFVRLFSFALVERPDHLREAGALFATAVLNDAHRAAPGNAIPDLNNAVLLVSSLSSFILRIEQTSTGSGSASSSDVLKLWLGALLSKRKGFRADASSSVAGNYPTWRQLQPCTLRQHIAPTPAVSCAAPTPALTYAAPALSVLAAQAPPVTYAAPAPAATYAAPGPAVTYAPTVSTLS